MKYKGELERINKLKPELIEAFVQYYGEEYRDQIQERINSVKFFPDTNPVIAKRNVEKYPSRFSVIEKLKIFEEYKKYEKVRKSIKRELETKMVDAIFDVVKDVVPDKRKIQDNFKLFSNNFGSSCIDAFSSQNLRILNSKIQSKILKESIKRDQKKFLSAFGVKEEFVSTEKVDKFIKFRESIKRIYNNEVAIKSNYGKRYKQLIEGEIESTVEDYCIQANFYNTNLSTFSWSKTDNGLTKAGCVIRLPLFDMRIDSKKHADLCFIHEMIHNVETVVDVGIMDADENNRMANEIRTQMVARKIAAELFKRGIIIFDTSMDEPVRLEGCLYDNMLPLVEGIFDKYETFISKCAIEGKPRLLEVRFGKSEWQLFSQALDDLYEEFGKWDIIYCEDIEEGEFIKELRKKMDYNFKKSDKVLTNR